MLKWREIILRMKRSDYTSKIDLTRSTHTFEMRVSDGTSPKGNSIFRNLLSTLAC